MDDDMHHTTRPAYKPHIMLCAQSRRSVYRVHAIGRMVVIGSVWEISVSVCVWVGERGRRGAAWFLAVCGGHFHRAGFPRAGFDLRVYHIESGIG